jgi:uncharacterized delta-60 repeat protein
MVRSARVVALLVTIAALIASAALAARHLGTPKVTSLGPGSILAMASGPKGEVAAVGYSGKNMLVVLTDQKGAHRKKLRAGRGVAYSVAIQADGSIVVGGTSSPFGTAQLKGDAVIKRFRRSGAVDRSFGRGGTVKTAAGVVGSIALGRKNTIVGAGAIPGADSTPRVALVRVHGNGSLDNSFGSRGVSEIDLGPYSEANAILVQKSGKIVFAGDQAPRLQVVNGLVGRVTAGGRLDRSFGRQGVYLYEHPHGGGASGFKALLSVQGKIVAAGGDVQNSGQHALFVGLSGRGGQLWTLTAAAERNASSGENFGASALARARNGDIVAAGKYLDSGLSYGTVWSLTAGGHLDGRQAPGGLLRTKLPGRLGGEASAITVTTNGTIFTGGDLIDLKSKRAFVARYR